MQNKLAILLTVFSLTLMLVGVGAGTLLTQKQTRTASLAATGATCADTPWDWNGDHHADGACGAALGFPPGSIGGPISASQNTPDTGKYVLCRTPSAQDQLPPPTGWGAVGDTWYGPCDTLSDAQAAHDAIFGQATTAPGQPSATPVPGGSAPPTAAPTLAPTTISTSIIFKFILGSQKTNSVDSSNPAKLAVEVKNSLSKIILFTKSVAIKDMGITTPLQNFVGNNFWYQESTNIPVSIQIPTSPSIVSLDIHVFTTDTNNNPDPNAYICGATRTYPVGVDNNITLLDSSQVSKFLNSISPQPFTLTIDCTSGKIISVQAQQYTRQDVQNAINGYTGGTISPLQISRFLVDYQQGLGLQMQFCDPTTGGCTPKF